jgi:peptidoglycan/LPS O-acetylase OafA/YrhL
MEQVQVPARKRIPSLDGWRAIAIILVLGSHMDYADHVPPAVTNWVEWVFDGALGVQVFFVLSGFLISLLLLKESEQGDGISLKNFYLRRAYRILPIYFAYLLVLAVLELCGLYRDSAGSWIGCLTFTRNMLGRGNSGTAHFWSLAVEEQFYLIWPVLMCCLGLWKRRGLYFAALLVPIIACPVIRANCDVGAVGGTVVDRIFGPRSILSYADSLAVGCIGAWMVWRTRPGWEWRGRHTAVAFASIAGVVAGHFALVVWHGPVARSIVPLLRACAILGCIVLGTQESSPGFGLLNSRAMVAIGVLSYSLYVWHLAFLGAFMGPRLAELPGYDWKVWLVPAAAVSVLSYNFLEQPFMRLRRRYGA